MRQNSGRICWRRKRYWMLMDKEIIRSMRLSPPDHAFAASGLERSRPLG